MVDVPLVRCRRSVAGFTMRVVEAMRRETFGSDVMLKQEPTTETIDAAGGAIDWGALLDEVARGHHRVIIERDGAPVAAVVSVRDLERWQRLDADRARRFAALDESQAAFRDLPDDEVEREVERALAEVRAESRRRNGSPTSAP